MSFILDALKKSELERQRQSMPGLIEVPVAPKRRGLPMWAVVLSLLLLVNVGVVSVLLLRNGAKSPPAKAERLSAQAPAPAPAAQEPDHFSPLDKAPAQAPVFAPEIPVEEPQSTRPAPRANPQVTGTSDLFSPPQSARRADPILHENTEAEDRAEDEVLPSINELNLTGADALPEMHIDVHVYATRAQDRFVYINMRKYQEGSTLQEGPTLERIRRDGVVLKYRNLRFLLPRQS